MNESFNRPIVHGHRLWSEAIAIGKDDFRENINRRLKAKNIRGKMVTCDGTTVLKEPRSSYNTLLGGEKTVISLKKHLLY